MKPNKRQEDILRAEIYKHYHDNNIDQANRMVGTFQEFAPAQIMQKKPLGLTPGVSDLIFFGDYATGYFEIKAPNSTHSLKHVKRQAELLIWYQNNVKTGTRGYFITQLEGVRWAIDVCNGTPCIRVGNIGIETANEVYNRILALEKKGRKTIKF